MLPRCSMLALAIALVAACGDDSTGRSAADSGQDARVRPDVDQQHDLDAANDDPEVDATSDVADMGGEVSDTGDASPDPDVGEPDATSDANDVVDATADASDGIPDATDDCEPMGIPDRWSGTFEGDIESDIPDMAGYTFQGPVNGEISFEIRCVNQKLVVFGELDGGATNCALATGCPFTARLDGVYNPETRHMEGDVLDAEIDYTFVQVYAEGVFEGTVSDSLVLSGTWNGEMTGSSLPLLDRYSASGEGTWVTTPL